MIPITSIILAAGEGKRMKSALPKVLHTICGLPLVEWVIRASSFCEQAPVVVVGNGADQVMEKLHGVRFAMQQKQLGTGHAVMMAKEYLQGLKGYVLVLAGDMPLLRQETLEMLCEAANDHAAALLTTQLHDPTGYGRILRDSKGFVTGIVEHRDATKEQLQIKEVNVSAYCFKIDTLLDCLDKLSSENAQNEYYITDCIALLSGRIAAVRADADECLGVNDRAQLSVCNALMQKKINTAHMLSGVTMLDPQQTYIDADVKIGRDVVIYPNNILQGQTVIDDGATLYPGCRLLNCQIGAGCMLEGVVGDEAVVSPNAKVGPFVHLRPKAVIGSGCRIGNFVEVKNSNIGSGSKVSHLTYVGDGDIGKDCNVGCGVVFVNYDGANKHRTVVHDKVFIGCNVNLVAPVEVGDEAYIAAGSTITGDVPPGSLAIARERQTVKEDWAYTHKRKT